MLLSRGQINNTRCIAVVFYILYTDTKRVLLKPFLGSSVVFICIQIFLHSVFTGDSDHAPSRDDLWSAGWDLLELTYGPNLKFLILNTPSTKI